MGVAKKINLFNIVFLLIGFGVFIAFNYHTQFKERCIHKHRF